MPVHKVRYICCRDSLCIRQKESSSIREGPDLDCRAFLWVLHVCNILHYTYTNVRKQGVNMNTDVMMKRMKELDLRPTELSKQSGIPLATISRILNGVITDPKVSTARRIAEVLNVKVDEII